MATRSVRNARPSKTSWPTLFTLALCTAFCGLFTAMALVATAQYLRPDAILLLPLSETHLDRARNAVTDPSASQRDIEKAVREATIATELSPNRPEAWLTLSYALRRLHGHPTTADIEALARSYEIAPLDADIDVWRSAYAYESWPALSPALRNYAQTEVRAMWSRCAKADVLSLPRRIRNSERLPALRLEITSLQLQSRYRACTR